MCESERERVCVCVRERESVCVSCAGWSDGLVGGARSVGRALCVFPVLVGRIG